jgi:galactitol-specific phosphotransferase system IIB component
MPRSFTRGATMKKILLSAHGAMGISLLDRISNGLKKRGLDGQFSLTKCKVIELAKLAPQYDIIIRTAMLTEEVEKQVINGISLATGGPAAETLLDEIAVLVKA